MRNQPVLGLLLMFITGCGSNCEPSDGCTTYRVNGPLTDTPPAQTAVVASAAADEPEHDTLAFVTTEAGTFAVASVRPADEVRIYRVEATDTDEAPLTVTLRAKLRFEAGDAPGRVVSDDDGHALVTLRGGIIVTVDPVTAERVGNTAMEKQGAPVNTPVTQGDATAYVDDGDAYIRMGDEETFWRVGGPGITRSVGLADVATETVTRHVFAMQTETPRMLVFFTTADTTVPAAFEPLE